MRDLDPLATAPATEASGRKVCAGCGTANRPASVYCYKCGLELAKAFLTSACRFDGTPHVLNHVLE